MNSKVKLLLLLMTSFFYGCGPAIKEDQSVGLTKGLLQKTVYTNSTGTHAGQPMHEIKNISQEIREEVQDAKNKQAKKTDVYKK